MTGPVERHIRNWLDDFVVGLNLCPFARPLLGAPGLRISVCEKTDRAALRRAFLRRVRVGPAAYRSRFRGEAAEA